MSLDSCDRPIKHPKSVLLSYEVLVKTSCLHLTLEQDIMQFSWTCHFWDV